MLNFTPATTRKNVATAKERDDILENLSTNAYVLYEFYLSKASKRNYDFSDANVQKTLHYWKTSKIKAARLLLTKAGYFKQRTKLNTTTRVVDTTITDLRQADYNKHFNISTKYRKAK